MVSANFNLKKDGEKNADETSIKMLINKYMSTFIPKCQI